MTKDISHETLEKAFNKGRATLEVEKINHREYIMDGIRYVFGWSSPCEKRNYQGGWIIKEQISIQEFTKEWKSYFPNWATVIRCPRCNALVDDDWATCRACGLEVKHKTIGIDEILFYARDPEFIAKDEEGSE